MGFRTCPAVGAAVAVALALGACGEDRAATPSTQPTPAPDTAPPKKSADQPRKPGEGGPGSDGHGGY